MTPVERRCLLAAAAQKEVELGLCGDVTGAGPEIERYLRVFREALNRNCETDRYSDPKVGYSWCCAFVYYCCLQAGYTFSPKPEPHYRYTLAAVPAWHHWAESGGFFYAVDTVVPEPGDIALFNHVFDGNPLDHIGIVLSVTAASVRCAEGNVGNRTGLFERPFSCIAGLVRLS